MSGAVALQALCTHVVTNKPHLALQGAGERKFDFVVSFVLGTAQSEVGGKSLRPIQNVLIFVLLRFTNDSVEYVLYKQAPFSGLTDILLNDGSSNAAVVVQVDGLVVRTAHDVESIQRELLKVVELMAELPSERRHGDGAFVRVDLLRTLDAVLVDETIDDAHVASQDFGVGFAERDDTVPMLRLSR